MGGKTNSSTTTSTPAAAGAAASVISRANKLSKKPYVPYDGSLLANINPDQQSAFDTVNDAQGIANPYIASAEAYTREGAQPVSADDLSNYQNPYQQQVTDATLKNFGELNAQQLAQVKGNAIGQGALGGNRMGVAQGETVRQQDLAEAPVLAGINSQGFNTALSASQQDKARQGQAAFTMGGLGQEALGTELQGAQAQLGTGAIEQNQAQQGLNIPYQQFLQQQAFPYQQLGFASGVTGQLGALEGGTSTTTSPGPSPFSQIAGLGIAGLGVAGKMGWTPFAKDGGAIKGYAAGGAPYGGTGMPYGQSSAPYGISGGPYTDANPLLNENLLSGVPYNNVPYSNPAPATAQDPQASPSAAPRGVLGATVPSRTPTAETPSIQKMFDSAMKMAQQIRNSSNVDNTDSGKSAPIPSPADVALTANPGASAGIPGSQYWSGQYAKGGIVVSSGGAVIPQANGIYMPRGYDDGGTVDDSLLFDPNSVSSQDFVPKGFAPKQAPSGISPTDNLVSDTAQLGNDTKPPAKMADAVGISPTDDLTSLINKTAGTDQQPPSPAGIVPPMPNGRLPASVRNNNPGAQWPGSVASQFGATGSQNLADGNKIATFPTPVHGAAAQFALLNKNYVGIPLSQAITKWSGGNSSPAYVASIAKDTGLSPGTVITPDLLQGDKGVQLAKAMAKVETGRPYPMSDAQWKQGQSLAFNGEQPGIGSSPSMVPTDSPGISSDAIPLAAKPAQYRGDNSWSTPLIAAGLGMLASRSPNLGTALGEGGLKGLEAYTKQKDVDLSTRRLDQAADMAQKKLDETTKYHQGVLDAKNKKANPDTDVFAPPSVPPVQSVPNQPNVPQSDDSTIPAKAKPAQYEPEKDVDPTKPLTNDQIEKQQNYYGDYLNGTLKQVENSHAPGTHPEVLDNLTKNLGNQGKGVAATIKAVAEGRQSLTSVPSRTYEINGKKYSERVLVEQGVNLYKPDWEQGTAKQRAETLSDLSPKGKTGQLVLGVNQLLPHLKTASDAAEALNNSAYPAANSIKNWWQTATGDPTVKKFQTVRDVAALDAARILRGSGAMSIEEVRNWQHNINEASSPKQLHGVLNMLASDLMGARMNSINYQYRMLVGKDAPDLLSPESKAALKTIEARDTATNAPKTNAAPVAAPAGVPQRPSTVPDGSQYSPSRKAWRTPDGQVISAGP